MDDASFTKAYLAAQPALASYARKLCKHRERGEDLLQDANCKLWIKRAYYTEGNFLGWCKTVMKNHYLNQVEVESRMKYTDSAFATGASNDVGGEAGEAPNRDVFYTAKYLSQAPNQEDYWLENRIHECIVSLPPHTALLIQQKLQGLSYEQIAKVLGIKPNNAKQRYFNDIKTLRALLMARGLVDPL